MENIILIFFCLLLGIILQRVKDFPVNSYKTLNQFIIYVALPALVLFYIPKIKINSTLLFPLGIAWIGFILSFIFFYFIGKDIRTSYNLNELTIYFRRYFNIHFCCFKVVKLVFFREYPKW